METRLKIYLEPDRLLTTIPLHAENNTHISIGISELCDVPLAKFANENELKNIEATHVVIFYEDDSFFLSSPTKGNPPKLKNGQNALFRNLKPGEKVFFGNCSLIIETTGQDIKPVFTMTVKKSDELIAKIPLKPGYYSVGDKISGADLILPFSTEGRVILRLNVADDDVLLDPLSKDLYSGAAPMLDKTIADTSERYRYKDCSLSFLRNVNQTAQQAALDPGKILNICILILFVAAVYLSLSLFLGSAKQKEEKKPDQSHLSAEISKAIASGNIFKAMAIAESIPDSKQQEYSNIRLLNRALLIFNFHHSRLLLYEERLADNKFIKDLLNSENPHLTMNSYLAYFNAAEAELKEALGDIENLSLRPINKTYSGKFANLRKKLNSLSAFFSKFTLLNQAWQKEDWEEAVIILGRLTEQSQKAEMKGLLAICQKHLEIAKVGEKINSLNENMTDDNFANSPSSIQKFKKALQQIDEQIPENNSRSDLDNYGIFKKESAKIKNTLNSAGKILDLFLIWKKNTKDQKNLTNLVKEISKTPPARAKTLRKTILSISGQIREEIKEKIKEIDTTPSLKNLQECERFSSICDLASFFDPSLDNSLLLEKKGKIYSGLLNKCDRLFAEYNIAKNNSKHDARRILSEILANAPPDSRYRAWAKKELNDYQNNQEPQKNEDTKRRL